MSRIYSTQRYGADGVFATQVAATGGANIVTAGFTGINLASGSGSTSKLASASAAGTTHAVWQSASSKVASGIVQGATLTLCNITSGKVGSGASSAYAPIYGIAVGSKIATGIINASAAGYAPMFSASGGAKTAAGSSANHAPLLGIATSSKVAPGVVDASGSGYAPQFCAASHKFSSAAVSAYAPVTAAAAGGKYGAGSLEGWFGPSLSVASGAALGTQLEPVEIVELLSPPALTIGLDSATARQIGLVSLIG